jgi:sugar transferase (PEP-CTERM/EpsH1 system associated)
MTSVIRIAHVVHRLQAGGMENGLINLINRLPEEKYIHEIVCITRSTDFARRIAARNVRIHELNKRSGKDLGVYARFWKAVKLIEPDIVHTRNLGALDLAPIAALAGVPARIHSEHGWDISDPDGVRLKYRILRRCCDPAVTRYVSVSEDIRSWLCNRIGISERKIEHICNGVDVEKFTPRGNVVDWPFGGSAEDLVIIGTIGRLDPIKGIDILLRSVAQIIEEHPKQRATLRLVVVGDGSLKSDLILLAQELGLADIVLFTGQRNDIPEIFRSMQLFVLASLNEGISNTILEAMSSGLPVVVTNVGGNRELVGDGETGQLVPAKSSTEIAKAILFYINSVDRRQVDGNAGRSKAKRLFNIETMVKRYDALYQSLASVH